MITVATRPGLARACAAHPDSSALSSIRSCRRSRTITGSLEAVFESTAARQRLYVARVYRRHNEAVNQGDIRVVAQFECCSSEDTPNQCDHDQRREEADNQRLECHPKAILETEPCEPSIQHPDHCQDCADAERDKQEGIDVGEIQSSRLAISSRLPMCSDTPAAIAGVLRASYEPVRNCET